MTRIQQIISNNSQFLVRFTKYLVAGGLAFLVDYTVFLALFYIGDVPVGAAGAISFVLSFLTSFILQRQWVFASKYRRSKINKELLLYLLLATINILITVYGLILLHSIGVAAYIAKLLLIVLIMTWNYFLYRKVIFKSH